MKISTFLLMWSIASIRAVGVTVYYSSKCSDSIRFITEQLYPTWSKLTQKYLQVDFVPYGKSSQNSLSNGSWAFTCQHGDNECKHNKQHACALSVLPVSTQVPYISCLMSGTEEGGLPCANKFGIDYTPIDKCENSEQGNKLLAVYGDRTRASFGNIAFVPTVVFNGISGQDDQREVLDNFEKVVCRHIDGVKPTICQGS